MDSAQNASTHAQAEGAETHMNQYEIWWAHLPLPIGRRPVLLLSRTSAYRYLQRVVIVEITSTIRDIVVEVPLGMAEGLPQPCVANFDNIHVVAKAALKGRVGMLSEPRHIEAKRALGYAFDWSDLKRL